MLFSDQYAERVYWGPMLMVRPASIAQDMLEDAFLSSRVFKPISTDAWLLPGSAGKQYLVQGIVLEKLP